MKRKHEITTLAESDDGLMVLVDRCMLAAEDAHDAAKRHAALFSDSKGFPHPRLSGEKIGPDTPCTFEVEHGDNGSLGVTLCVPTYNGLRKFTLGAERDGGGDWVLFLPNLGGYDVHSGVAYLGAPDVERPAEIGASDE